MKDTDGAYSQLIRLQEAHQADGYQVDAGISHSRPIRSLSLQQSTSNPAGSHRVRQAGVGGWSWSGVREKYCYLTGGWWLELK